MSSEAHISEVVAHYDERAATYDENAMHRALADAVAAFVGEGAPGGEGGLALDVATGTGLALRALAGRVVGPVVGVDRSPRMLSIARDRMPGALLVRADATALPVDDGSVGLLTCVTGLHLFGSPPPVAAEWARVVRAGGSVVTATFTGPAVPPPGRPAARGRFTRNHEPYRTAEHLAATFGPGFGVARSEVWSHDEDGSVDLLLLCELRRSS